MKKLLITALCGALLVLSGCSAILKNADSAELIVQYATVKLIVNEDTPVERIRRAERIAKIARESKLVFDNRSLPLSEIETLVRDRINWQSLDVADVMLANALIDRVVSEIEESATLPESDVYVTGSQVLGWIIEAAEMAGAS